MAEKKYDVGIFGLWYGYNYGSIITYYALAKTIESLGKSYAMIRNPLANEVDINTLRRSHPVRFGFEHYPITPLYHLEEMHRHNEMFDAFVLGSDQMWNYVLSKPYQQSYFFDFANDDKIKVSYATSFGKEKYYGPADEKKITRKNLGRFNAISVRDDFSKDICERDFDVRAEIVTDPVFLCPREKYEDLVNETDFRIEGNYIAAYVLDPSPERGAALNHAAEKSGLDVYVVFNESNDLKQCQEALGPLSEKIKFVPHPTVQEWLSLIRFSKFMLTDSFHGACLSIILKKPFIVLKNVRRGGKRFNFLLDGFGLSNYLVESPEEMITKFDELGIDHQIDYDKAYQLIEPEVARSRKWLEDALNGKINQTQKKEEPADMNLPDLTSFIGLKMPEKSPSMDFENDKMLLSLLLQYGVEHVVLSSGTRHLQLVKMFEAEERFHTYNVLDERSAGFFAIGLSTRLQKPVAVCCTSGTAASNYLTACSEAFYQHVPIVFITADRYPYFLNQKEAQMIPQPNMYHDVCRHSVSLPVYENDTNRYYARRMICEALVAMTKDTKGPVHINVPQSSIEITKPGAYKLNKVYPKIDYIDYKSSEEEWTGLVNKLSVSKVAILYGQNPPVSEEFVRKLNLFVNRFNCVIAKEHLSNIHSDKCVEFFNLSYKKPMPLEKMKAIKPNIVITVNGNGAALRLDTFRQYKFGVEHWDIIESGHFEDPFRKLKTVVASTFEYFLDKILSLSEGMTSTDDFYRTWKKYEILDAEITPEYSERRAIYQMLKAIPAHSLLHLANSNTIRMASSYAIDPTIAVYGNRGTNGIDGSTSSFMGQCQVSEELCFMVVGDLSFFYDMNSLWNKDLKGNIRIMLMNNNGAEMLRRHRAKAITHVHNTSAKGWVESVGFRYLSSTNQGEFDKALREFVTAKSDKPIFFEVFC